MESQTQTENKSVAITVFSTELQTSLNQVKVLSISQLLKIDTKYFLPIKTVF